MAGARGPHRRPRADVWRRARGRSRVVESGRYRRSAHRASRSARTFDQPARRAQASSRVAARASFWPQGPRRASRFAGEGPRRMRRRANGRQSRQGSTDRRVLGDDDLERFGRQAHDRRLGRRLACEERISARASDNRLPSGPDVASARAPRPAGNPAGSHLPVKQLRGTRHLPADPATSCALRDDKSRTLAEHLLDARKEPITPSLSRSTKSDPERRRDPR